MRKTRLTPAVLALAIGGLLASGAGAAEVTLKAVSAFTQGTNFSKNFERFIDQVNAAGKGVVQINYVGGGGKVMNPFELGNAIRGGVVDIGNLPGAFYTTLMPEADALKMVDASLRDLRPGPAWDFIDKLHREKVNAFFLGRQKSKVPFHLYLNKKIDKMDLTGLKIRTTPIYRAFFASIGAVLLRTAPGEVFTALERGVVDDRQKAVLLGAASWMEEVGDAEDLEANKKEDQRQRDFGIEVIAFTGAAGREFLERASVTAWDAIIKANPETGPKLKELFGK